MFKKLKMWIAKKIFKDIIKMYSKEQINLLNKLATKDIEINNLKNRLTHYHNKGAL